MICPKCKSEYIKGTKNCIDCDKKLVSFLSKEKPLSRIKWVKLGPVTNRICADMICEILKADEIPHYIKTDFAFGVISGNQTGSNISVFIPENYRNITQDIIKSISGT